ncbi:uncharacterized protein LOC135379179 [Ornithodoros turicata]|uniref:uncharacterized protein LOC135379179 n=1 Tax=Ornithodoros turicata TaxID=34597 RepID=UPI0031387107
MRVTVEAEEAKLSNQVKEIWKLEHLGIQGNNDITDGDIGLQDSRSTGKEVNGRYQVSLPWKTARLSIPPNKEVAMDRLHSLTTKLLKNEHLIEQYDSPIRQYLREGHAEKVNASATTQGVTYYMPHPAVVKMDRESTNIRIVFDASSNAARCAPPSMTSLTQDHT